MTVFQKSSNKTVKTLEIKRLSNAKLKLKSMFIPPLKQFIKPVPLLEHFRNIASTVPYENIEKKNKLQDRTWAVCPSIDNVKVPFLYGLLLILSM